MFLLLVLLAHAVIGRAASCATGYKKSYTKTMVEADCPGRISTIEECDVAIAALQASSVISVSGTAVSISDPGYTAGCLHMQSGSTSGTGFLRFNTAASSVACGRHGKEYCICVECVSMYPTPAPTPAPTPQPTPAPTPPPPTPGGCSGSSRGSSASTASTDQLAPSQCTAWQAGYDAMTGTGWEFCADSRNDPCRCGLIKCHLGPPSNDPRHPNPYPGGAMITYIVFSSSSGVGAISNRKGTLPNEWGFLTELVQLDMSDCAPPQSYMPPGSAGCELSGTLPASWGAMTRLTSFRLAGNGMTMHNNAATPALGGTLPASWGMMGTAGEGIYGFTLQNLGRVTGTLPASWG